MLGNSTAEISKKFAPPREEVSVLGELDARPHYKFIPYRL